MLDLFLRPLPLGDFLDYRLASPSDAARAKRCGHHPSGHRVREFENPAVVRNDDHGPIAFNRHGPQQLQNRVAGLGVERAEVGSSQTSKCG